MAKLSPFRWCFFATIMPVSGYVLASFYLHFFHWSGMGEDEFAPFMAFAYLIGYYGTNMPDFMYHAYAIFFTFCFLPAFFTPKVAEKQKYGYAHDASKRDAKSMGVLQERGILLGRKWSRELRYSRPLSTLCLAPPGTGKTASFLIPNMLSIKNSIVVHDPKGELYRYTSCYRQTFSKVFLFDPVSDNTDKFNPLDRRFVVNREGEYDEGIARALLQNVANVLVRNSSSDSYWDKAARSLFIFCGMWLYWKYGEATLPAIRELVYSQPNFEDGLSIMMKGVDPRDQAPPQKDENGEDDAEPYYATHLTDEDAENIEELREEYNKLDEKKSTLLNISQRERKFELDKKIREFDKGAITKGKADAEAEAEAEQKSEESTEIPRSIQSDANQLLQICKSEGQTAGITGTLEPSMQIFQDPKVAAATSAHSDFPPELLRETPCSVYVVIREEDSDRLYGLVSLVLNTLAKKLMSREPEDHEQRVTFCLDEFTRLGYLENIAKMPDMSRGYDVNAIFVAQSYSQISNAYGRDYVDSFEQSCGYKIIFNQNDLHSAQKISKMIGEKTQTRTSKNYNVQQGIEKEVSESESEESRALYSTQDIMSLPLGKALVLVERHYHIPIKVDTVFWEKIKPYSELKKQYSYAKGHNIADIYSDLKANEKEDTHEQTA